MNSDKIYGRIYDSLERDFLDHLKAGDLYLYQTNSEGKLVKKGCWGRVWVRLSGSSRSTDVAKAMLADKLLQQTNGIDTQNPHSKTITDYQKNILLFEITKIAAAKGELSRTESIANFGIKY